MPARAAGLFLAGEHRPDVSVVRLTGRLAALPACATAATPYYSAHPAGFAALLGAVQTMPLRWHIDECSSTRIAGWIDDDGPVDFIQIAVNDRPVAAVSPTDFRQDLKDAGIGDGRRAFSVAIGRYLAEPVNRVAISRGERLLHATSLRSAAAIAAEAQRPRRTAARDAKRRPAGAPAAPLMPGVRRVAPSNPPPLAACDFYHVVDLPDGTTTQAQWDLRDTADDYLGHVDFAGKRVIEIGPASGFLSFHMERSGARVAVIEPPMDSFWDVVPQAGINRNRMRQSFAAHIGRIRNSFWYLHDLYDSGVECYELDAYRIPEQADKFDIGVLASVLLHVSSPVRMLESVAAVVADQLIIVERYFPDLASQPVSRLVPTAANRSLDTWWEFSPLFFEQYLAVLGFRHITVLPHLQHFLVTNESWEMFTVVATR